MRRSLVLAVATAAALTLTTPLAAAAPPAGPDGAAPGGATVAGAPGLDRRQAENWVRDTWRSFTAMTEPTTGMPADNIGGSLDPATRSRYTSPTNIGSYLWSAIVAEKLRVIDRRELVRRTRQTLDAVGQLERHPASGQFYNWYDPVTLEKLLVWPVDGGTVYPFASSVDNAWLATALMVIRNAVPEVRAQAQALLAPMDFAFYFDPNGREPGVGLMRGGFWDAPPPGCSLPGNYTGEGPEVYYTCHTYGAFNSETRMISYVAITLGQVPPEHYFAPWRTFPDTCDWGWQEQKPQGEWREYAGVPVFQGRYAYRGLEFVPSWGGSMFEAFMPDMFVPEAKWGPRSWARQHPAFVRGQIEHGLRDARYGHWGFSPSSDPFAEYREYGVDIMGLDTPGYASDRERTSVDVGFEGCREPQPPPAAYGDGVVTPHAVFLGLAYQPAQALVQLIKLRTQFDSYGPGGFYDAIAVRSGAVAKRYLALDQGMIMGALGNLLANDVLRNNFSRGDGERLLRPVIGMEDFGLPARQ